MKSMLIGVFLFSYTFLSAQMYFEKFEDEYTPLTDFQVLTYGVWDDPNLYIPLEFDFIFFGQTINSLYSFAGYHNELHTSVSEDSTINILIPLYADLIDPGINSGQSEAHISYKTEGSPPNRICKIQWHNCAFYNEGDEFSTYYDRANFQVWLYENSNIIEYRYGEINMINPTINLDTQGAYIGMINTLNLNSELNEIIESEWHLAGYAAYPELADGIETINDIYSANLLYDLPTIGTVYRFENKIESTSINEISTLELVTNIIEDEIIIQSRFGASYNLYSVTGQIIQSGEIPQGKTNVSCAGIIDGIYFLEISNSSEKKTYKLVKN